MQEIERLALYKITTLIIITILFSNNSYSQRFPNSEINKLLDLGIEYILNQNYELAKSKFTLLDKNHPDLPLGKIYLAVLEITKAFDLGEDLNISIDENLDSALQISEYLHNSEPVNLWYNYFVALSKGYKAYYKALNGEWISAISTGISSVNYFEDCLEIDSTFYEAYIALGTYKFWKSKKLEFLEWLPFIADESSDGIRYLETALEKTSYNKNLAAVSLIWIYIENKNFHRAIRIAEEALKKNPINRTLKWGLARAYEDVNPLKSILVYQELLASYQKIPNQNHFHELTLKHLLAQQYVKIGDKRNALRLCEEILMENKLHDDVREKLEDRIKRVEKLKKDLLK
jgi:predicted Zn-dependent protease